MAVARRVKSAMGYMWAASCLIVVLGTFVGMNFWERTLAEGTGIHISPIFSGGEILQTIDHGNYRTLVHRMVFDGLVGERAEGFVQIDWVPKENRSLPAAIEEVFDLDGDAAAEFGVRIDTVEDHAQLVDKAPWVLEAEPLVSVDSEKILRVHLRNPHR